jgi:hypothetical protein
MNTTASKPKFFIKQPYWAGLSVLFFVTLVVSCAPSAFNRDADCGPGCQLVGPEGIRQISYSARVTGGVVDILFVDDNSGSMSFEQNKMANAFSNFIATLDSNLINYRIAVTTTDVVDPKNPAANPARSINLNGGLQNGNLVRFANGTSFLEPGTANKEALFRQVISRQETATCENYLNSVSSSNAADYLQNCPSPDERGIFAANMAVTNNPDSFIRSDSHLAIVFLSDEDVRSQLYDKIPSYQLEARDLPQNLVKAVNQLYPSKSLSMHSLIVRPGTLVSGLSAGDAAVKIANVIGTQNQVVSENRPEFLFNSNGDNACLQSQNTQTNNVSGSYGYLYALAVRMTNGIEGNICSASYGSQLVSIGQNIGRRGHDITLGCARAKVLEYRYQNKAGQPKGSIRENVFEIDLTEPIGTEVFLKIECPVN